MTLVRNNLNVHENCRHMNETEYIKVKVIMQHMPCLSYKPFTITSYLS